MKYFLILFGGLCLTAGANAQTTYNIVSFSVPNSTYTTVVAINNSGEAVGFYGTADPDHMILGFDRSPSGIISTVIPPGTTGDSLVEDINDAGEIVGVYDAPLGNLTVANGFISYAGKFRTVDVRGASTQLSGLNNQGTYVGIYRGLNYYPGFWFSRSTGFSIVRYPGSSSSTIPTGINESNVIVGTYEDINGSHGFLLDSAGEYGTIDRPGATSTTPSKINDAGLVVGYWTRGGTSTGFLYKGSFQDFKVPGAVNTYLNGISDNGLLCGDYSDSSGKQLGFIATPAQ